jgi:putative flippase GtrA
LRFVRGSRGGATAGMLRAFLCDKSHSGLQVLKYLFFGGITFVVDVVVFYAMAWLVLPSLRADDPFVKLVEWLGWGITPVGEDLLLRNYYINKGICFLVSNTVAYITNQLFVFYDGRHNRATEALLFYLVSTFSFVTFTWLSGVLIGNLGWDVTYSYLFVFAMAMITNFTVRKRFVFKG